MYQKIKIGIPRKKIHFKNFSIFFDNFSDALIKLGALSIAIDNLNLRPIPQKFKFPDYTDEYYFTLFLPNKIDVNSFLFEIMMQFQVRVISIEQNLDKIDWVQIVEASYVPIKIFDKIWIGASWHKKKLTKLKDDLIRIYVDPGMAFGTGAHPTTKLCLQSLVKYFEKENPHNVLDLGCGSGVLTIASSKLGKSNITAIDNDPVALEETKKNLIINKVHMDRIILSSSVSPSSKKFDLIVSNILLSTLKELSELIIRSLNNGGGLILSGILQNQENELIKYFDKVSKNFVKLRQFDTIDDWSCLTNF